MASEFEAAITKAVDDGVIAGAAVFAVGKNGDTLYANAFGNRVLGDSSKPMGLDSVGWLASCSKISTCVAALQAVERGLLTLDEPISKVLPELTEPDLLTGFDDSGKPVLKKATKVVTLRHLLSHSSGLSYSFMSPKMAQYYEATGKKPKSPRGYIREDLVEPLVYEPGEGWEYSTGIDWAGQAVERVNGGMRLGEYLQKNVFGPLGVKDTSFDIADPTTLDRRLGHTFRATPDGKAEPDTPDLGMYLVGQPLDDYGGAGLHSSAAEYIKILRSLLVDDGVLLKPETAAELFRPQLPDPKYIAEKMDNPKAAAFLAPSYGAGLKWNHGLGGALLTDGLDGRVSAGTMQWAGLPNNYWWIDRERGTAGVFIDELYPPADALTQQLFAGFQKAAYTLAGASAS